jgi:hypothetical protein
MWSTAAFHLPGAGVPLEIAMDDKTLTKTPTLGDGKAAGLITDAFNCGRRNPANEVPRRDPPMWLCCAEDCVLNSRRRQISLYLYSVRPTARRVQPRVQPMVYPISARIMRGAPMGGWFLSRRDSTIVARHEVPGIMRKIARPSGTIEPISACGKNVVIKCFVIMRNARI